MATKPGLGELVVKVLVAAVLLTALCMFVELEAAADALRAADPAALTGALAASVVGVLISVGKWQSLLRQARIVLPVWTAARLYWTGMFCSNFLPTSVGGDAVRLLLTPAPGRLSAVAGTILVERLTGFTVMLALCIIGLAMHPGYATAPGLLETMLVALLGLSGAVALVLIAPRRLAFGLARLGPRLPAMLHRPAAQAAAIIASVNALASDWRVLGRALGLSVAFYATIILAQYGVLSAVDAGIPLAEVALIAAVVPLLTLVPVSLNGLGVAEGVFVLLYAQAGVHPELALAAAMLRRLVDLANSGFGGLLWLAHRAGTRPVPDRAPLLTPALRAAD